MKKTPEGGQIGTAQAKSYTFFLTIAAGCALFWFTGNDIKEGGTGYLRIALGLHSKFWIWSCIIVGPAVSSACAAGVAASLYRKFTGLTYAEDRIGYAKSGGADIAFWSAYLSFIAMLALFTWVIPADFLGFFRPFVLLGLSLFSTFVAARAVSAKVFSLLYGSPSENSF